MAIGLIVLALLLRFVFIVISLAHLPATSDEAIIALMAKMIVRGDFPLLFLGQPRLFPVESYLMAPLIEWLPRNAFGARYQMMLQGLLSTGGFLLIAWTAYPPGKRWPAAVLILFPSAYLLMLTSGYAPPHYPMEITLAWVCVFLLLKWRKNRRILLLALVGFFSGLSFSNHMISITISAGLFLLIVFDGSNRNKSANILLFASTFFVGMVPYLLAIWTIPGAYGTLPEPHSLPQIISTMRNSLFTETFSRAMGMNSVLFPDYQKYLNWWPALQGIFSVGYLALLALVAVDRIFSFSRAVAARCYPKLELVDLAVAVSILNFGVFVTHQTLISDHRYLLPAVLFFPFLMAHAFEKSPGKWKMAVSGVILCLAVYNVASSMGVIKFWSNRDSLEEYSDTPAIDDLLENLNIHGITHCYASYWLAYRITFESDEKIICAEVFNERFPFWPIPYKDEVDKFPNSVYVLTQTHWAKLTALKFQTDLKKAGMDCRLTKVPHPSGSFHIYSHCDFPASKGEREIEPENYFLTTNGDQQGFEFLQDGNFATGWLSPVENGQSLWLQAVFATPQLVDRVTLFHLKESIQPAAKIDIFGKEAGDGRNEWRPLMTALPSSPSPVWFHNNHPVYGAFPQRIDFRPTLVNALKIAVTLPKTPSKWGLSEVKISSVPDHLHKVSPEATVH